MPSSEVTTAIVDDHPEAYEERHVHVVYNQIASHFSSTRYKVAKPIVPLMVVLNNNSLGPLSQSFYWIYPPDGWGSIQERATGNTYPCPQTIQGKS
jgi:hypothetical protein